MINRPLAIDLFCGLFGWSEGLVSEGFQVIGFDLEDMCGQFGRPRPKHAQLVLQDVTTLAGWQFKDADLIVASPPCQEYSYMAMPWSLAKAKAAEYRSGERDVEDLNRLFNACFRIQQEACEAAGRHIPMVVENVRGAIPWVGRSRWNYGSFHLWGDVPALMPAIKPITKMGGRCLSRDAPPEKKWGGHNVSPSHDDALEYGHKVPGSRFDGSGKSFQSASVEGVKGLGCGSASWEKGKGTRNPNDPRNFYSTSPARKAASAMIAKIPLPLSRHIARTYRP